VIYAVPAILLFAIAVIIKYDPAHTSAQYLIVRACLLGHAKQPAAVQQSAQADLPESGRFWNVVAVLPSCHRESSCPCSAGGLPHAFGGIPRWSDRRLVCPPASVAVGRRAS